MTTTSSSPESMLPIDFAPTKMHVIIARGKKYYKHEGNLRLRQMVQSQLANYQNAINKSSKSKILSDIVRKVRSTTSYGGFVQEDKQSGQWMTAGDHLAREKTSQAFRDALQDKYKSSRVAKKMRRRRQRASSPPMACVECPSSPPQALHMPKLPSASSSSLPLGKHAIDAMQGNMVQEMDLLTALSYRLASQINKEDHNPFEPTPIMFPNHLS